MVCIFEKLYLVVNEFWSGKNIFLNINSGVSLSSEKTIQPIRVILRIDNAVFLRKLVELLNFHITNHATILENDKDSTEPYSLASYLLKAYKPLEIKLFVLSIISMKAYGCNSYG